MIGCLGDCWFLSAVSTVCSFDNVLSKVLVSYDAIKGEVKLQFYKQEAWRPIVIDDYLPCLHGQPAFARSAEKGELWVSFIEKAYAKLHGSYAAIIGGITSDALTDLTGGVGFRLHFSTLAEREVKREEQRAKQSTSLANSNALSPPPTHSLSGSSSPSSKGPLPGAKELWARMDAVFSRGTGAMGCSANKDNAYAAKYGITTLHAYSVLGVFEIPRQGLEPIKMVLCRNPHGSTKYSGPFHAADKSSWGTIPLVHRDKMLAKVRKDEGCSWMPLDILMTVFTNMDFCYLPTKFQQSGKQYGEWAKKDNSATGVFSSSQIGMYAPMFELRVGASNGTRHIVLSLAQQDTRINNRPLMALGMHVMTYPEGTPSDIDTGSRVQAFDKAHLHCKTPSWTVTREQVLDVILKPGPATRLCVVPSVFDRGNEGLFCIRSFSNTSHMLLKAKAFKSYFTTVSTQNSMWAPASGGNPSTAGGSPARGSFACSPQHTFMISSNLMREVHVDIALYQTKKEELQHAIGVYVLKANPRHSKQRLFAVRQKHGDVDVPPVAEPTFIPAPCVTQNVRLTTNTAYILVPCTHGAAQTGNYILTATVPSMALAPSSDPLTKMHIGNATNWTGHNMATTHIHAGRDATMFLSGSGNTEFGLACHTDTGRQRIRLIIEGPYRFKMSHYGYCQFTGDFPSGKYTVSLEAEPGTTATLAVRAPSGVAFH
ncbi:peptidase C2, calpain family [Kipferlia bialata]|uniref:Peptidase C2, calpain family n=1 Tax=Kipferlia bialata TaxID=797122 RepID=A0A9K3CTA1_9EUKA|nr:peptidase C2, calpain family [Kipferlia bialata]|eukprot:g4003.t1